MEHAKGVSAFMQKRGEGNHNEGSSKADNATKFNVDMGKLSKNDQDGSIDNPTAHKASMPLNEGTTVIVSKSASIKDGNKPGASANKETRPVVAKNTAPKVTGEKEGSGARSTDGNPSYSAMGSDNKKESKALHISPKKG